MNFDTNILNVICEHIDDPKTFFNFALVSHKTRYVIELHKNNKMDQFTIEHVKQSTNYFKHVERRLPNGKLHGIKVCYCSNIFADDFAIYHNGICLVKWWSRHCKGLGEKIFITFFKCDCTKGKSVQNSYITDKIGLDGYKVIETMTLKCNRCGIDNLKEMWCNFEL